MTMDPERYERLHELFAAVVEMPEPERERFLDRECADDPDCRDLLARMLDDADSTSPHLGSPALGERFDLSAAVSTIGEAGLIGQQIGQYRLERLIAAGGMGVVYEARQEKPARTVAVKVMRRSLTSRSALRRFEYESQILARLQHPGIAQVHEAGVWHLDGESDAVPYFAMELIPEAVPITEYAARERLGLRDRIELFTLVCEAVQHGHQKGVIHRDLKPANILVNSAGRPVIIDFGVARATDGEVALTTLQTDVGQLIGTVQYMSPEQCGADPQDIDTRSDVYALGVVLYELLCETLPYDVSSAALHEAVRIVREQPPTSLSTIRRALRGDVETIAMKALEKERDRRYVSASALARALRRYLDDEPIDARPPSAMYQLRKFAHRNRALVGGAVVAFVALTVGIVVASGQAASAERARQDAVNAQESAEREAARATAVYEFMHQALTSVDPANRDVTLVEMLGRAAVEAEDAFPDQPLDRAELMSMIRAMYYDLGYLDEAHRHATRAAEILEAELGFEHDETLAAWDLVVEIYMDWHHVTEGLAVARRVFAARQAAAPEAKETVGSQVRFGDMLRQTGELEEAKRVLTEALEIQRRTGRGGKELTASAMNNLAMAVEDLGDLPAGERLHRDAIDIYRALEQGPDRERAIEGRMRSLLNLAWNLGKTGRFAEALELQQEVLDTRLAEEGEKSERTIRAMNSVAGSLARLARYEDAIELAQRGLDIAEAEFGPDNPQTLSIRSALAVALEQGGRLADAEPHYRAALESNRRVYGPHQNTLVSIYNLAWHRSRDGDMVEARELFDEVLELTDRVHSPDHYETLFYHHKYAEVLREADDSAAAIGHAQRAYDGRLKLYGPDHLLTLASTDLLAVIHMDLQQYEKALPLARLAAEHVEAALAPQRDARLGRMHFNYGTCLMHLERYDVAAKWLESALGNYITAYGEDHDKTRQVRERLAEVRGRIDN